MDEGLKKVFLKLPEFFGSPDRIAEAGKLTDNPQAQAAIRRLEQVHSILESYGLADYVSYDLACSASISITQALYLRHIHTERAIIL